MDCKLEESSEMRLDSTSKTGSEALGRKVSGNGVQDGLQGTRCWAGKPEKNLGAGSRVSKEVLDLSSLLKSDTAESSGEGKLEARLFAHLKLNPQLD